MFYEVVKGIAECKEISEKIRSLPEYNTSEELKAYTKQCELVLDALRKALERVSDDGK